MKQNVKSSRNNTEVIITQEYFPIGKVSTIGIITAMKNTRKKIAVVTMGVKLGDETRGYTRFRFLSELLAARGFEVDLITSAFQHWDKQQRDCSRACYRGLPYQVVFINEPGYQKNLDFSRIKSHAVAAKNLRDYFEKSDGYDLVYAEIPPNDIARVCAEYAHAQTIPFIADINDLWPEAMRMVVNIPVISDIAFYPFARDAKITYELLSGAIGTSDEYAARPAQDRKAPFIHDTVYVGNELSVFDAGVTCFTEDIEKPTNEIWVVYAGTLGASYDLRTLIEAAAIVEGRRKENTPQTASRTTTQDSSLPAATSEPKAVRIKVLGDGPDRVELENLTKKLNAPVDFLGYADYAHMAAYLSQSDITINSLVKAAVQSVVTKIGDYLASGRPMINTGSSPEFREKVSADGFGINVEAEDAEALACAIERLATNPTLRKIMGVRARSIAESQFDQQTSYLRIVDMIHKLI